ncbi:MAG: hypothetical protein WAX69_20260 [Victivallales bacterium]
MNQHSHDIAIIRELARQVMEAAANPKYEARRKLWTAHNSLKHTRPLVQVHCGRYAAFQYELIKHECADPLYRDIEFQLRHNLFTDWIDDDSILHPWVRVGAVFSDPGWGIHAMHVPSSDGAAGAYKLADEPGITPADVISKKMRQPRHVIDEAATHANAQRACDAVGDLIPVVCDRTTQYISFGADISYTLGQFLGMERLMMHMYDDPAWMHELLAFLRDGILAVHAEAEKAGDFTAISQVNQAEPYADGTAPFVPNGGPLERKRLWGFFAAQEYALISPEMHEEFLFRYQLPIMEKFGLVAYGCCEDLTRKMDMLRHLKNLRRIAVTPWADVAACARQIEDKYVISWRPNPAPICQGLDLPSAARTLRDGLAACAGCHVDITLKDIQTVQNEPGRLKEWAHLAKTIAEEYV